MKEEKESIMFLEEGCDSMSCYSKDYKHAYSIPEDSFTYRLLNGCEALELTGQESMIEELILPTSFCYFNVKSINYLPYLRKITAYSDFFFVSECDYIEHNVTKFWRDTQLEEISVLPWLVDKYKKIFGYWPGLSEAIIKVTPIPDDISYKLVNQHSGGFTTSKNGKTIVKVNNNIKVLEIPIEIDRVAATAFSENNNIEKIIILGDCEDYHKNRNSLDFDKDAINSLTHTRTLVFQGPMFTHFYDNDIEGAKMPNLKTIIYPLWNYNHYCFRGSEAEGVGKKSYEIIAENFSSVELVEEDGIVYTKDGKFLVSGVDCKSKSFRIKDGVEEIFKYAFCCNLAIEEVYIPRSVTKVGENAFKSCSNIKKIIFNFDQVSKDSEHAFFTYSHVTDFYLPDTELSSVIKNQYENLHYNFRRLGLGTLTENLVTDNSVNVIIHTLPFFEGEVSVDEETGMVFDEEGKTFVGVLKEQAKDKTIISLPNHIEEVNESAFSNLSSVEKIIAPRNLNAMQIFEKAKNCPKLNAIVVGEEHILIEDGIVYSHDYKKIIRVSPAAKIPSFICKDGIEVICPHAFEGHHELTCLRLSQSIKIISKRAFANTGISEIVFPASLETIGKEAFALCNLSAVVFEGSIAEGYDAFNKATFTPSASIRIQKKFKDDFIKKYPKLKRHVKTPLPKWLSWLKQ